MATPKTKTNKRSIIYQNDCESVYHLNRKQATSTGTHRYGVTKYGKHRAKQLIDRCLDIREILFRTGNAYKWIPNAIEMLSLLHPNAAFDLSSIDITKQIDHFLKTQQPLNPYLYSNQFNKYLKKHYGLKDIKYAKKLCDSLSGNGRFMDYKPVIPLLSLNNKLPGNCEFVQEIMIEVFYQFPDIMNTINQIDPDCNPHIDIGFVCYQQQMDAIIPTLNNPIITKNNKLLPFKKIKNVSDYIRGIFKIITSIFMKNKKIDDVIKIVIQISKSKHNVRRTAIEMKPLKHLNQDRNKTEIDKRINDVKNGSMYYAHFMEVFQRYVDTDVHVPNMSNDDDNKFEEAGYFQYSLICFPKLLYDVRTYCLKGIFCVGGGVIPFTRHDIINIIPRLFGKTKGVTKQFMDVYENNIPSSKRIYLNDVNYEETLRKFNECK